MDNWFTVVRGELYRHSTVGLVRHDDGAHYYPFPPPDGGADSPESGLALKVRGFRPGVDGVRVTRGCAMEVERAAPTAGACGRLALIAPGTVALTIFQK